MMKRLAEKVEALQFVVGYDYAWYVPLAWIGFFLFGWLDFSREVQGVLVKGVPEAAPTTSKLRNLYLKFFGWKKGAYFRVTEDQALHGYYVGYRATTVGQKKSICLHVCHDIEFMMGIGKEDCYFFAIDRHGDEIPIKYVGTFFKSDNEVRRARAF